MRRSSEVIESRDNARLRRLRGLRRDRRLRDEGSEGLLEGPHLIEAAVHAGLEVSETYATPAFLASDHPVLALLPRPPIAVGHRLLDELADADSPRGILACSRLPAGSLEEWQARAAQRVLPGRPVVAVDGLQDPGNLGALARVAEAAGAGLLALTPGTVDWRHPRALRASTGSLLRLPVLGPLPLARLHGALAGASPLWIGLAPRGGAPVWQCESLAARPVVLVLGSESGGLSAAAAAHLDLRLSIPMAAPVESINATAAAAIVLFELARQRALGT